VKGDDLRDSLEMKFPTASLAEMQFDVERWSAIKEGSAKLTRFIRPRDLDPTLGPEAD
jgi:phosphohistidine phosphatase